MRTLSLHTSDGHTLGADVAEPEGLAVGSVVICHPHPQFGGDRHNNMVEALFAALPPAGFTVIRFDFRAAHDGGAAERLDVIAAIDEVAVLGSPLFVVGYSFGALVALATTDERVAATVAIAPPLTAAVPAPVPPTLVLTPRHDQFCPPDVASAIVEPWPDAELEVVEGADHFLAGSAATVAKRSTAWLLARLTPG